MASLSSNKLALVPCLLLLLLLTESTLGRKSNVYIVYMGDRSHKEPGLAQEFHHELLSEVVGSKEVAKESILYSYKHGFSGFSAVLTKSQARLIADSHGVVRVFRNRILRPQTTRSWDFLQVKPHKANGILSESHSGVGSIIGVLDTGIWPESKSFNDVGMGKVPARWKGICQKGEEFNLSNCNRKLIGARWYVKGYEAEFGKLNTSGGVEFLSPRDAMGHGTHTSSTAAGALVENASYKGLALGLARGGAPSAWLAIYKVCWATGGCSTADILAAIDDAIHDGVNVLSVSLGSSPPLPTYVDDPLAIGSFHAVAKGISVVCSAGNSGPYPQTVINTAPWIVTVAASTIDRSFLTMITLGNNQTLMGQAIYAGETDDEFHSIVSGEDIAAAGADEYSARSCGSGTLNATLAKGKVILCFQSPSQRTAVTAKTTVMDVQGSGLIFAQFPSKDVTLSTGIPIVHVDFAIGTSLLTYMEYSRNPIVKFSFTKITLGQQVSPEVAFFSSRGPSSLSPAILKPDIAAPGVSILAAWSPVAISDVSDMTKSKLKPVDFKIESGTSMACPHISGIVALIQAIHQSWSPAAILSALVTTASTKDAYGENIVAEGAPHKQADPFDFGGGHVDPNKAINPGLIFDIGVSDYAHFLCSMGYNDSAIGLMTRSHVVCKKSPNFLLNLNLPSITIPELKHHVTITRTVTNVGWVTSVYTARVQSPAGTFVEVEPSILVFHSLVKKLKFRVTIWSQFNVQGRYSFGHLTWEDGFHVVRMPLVVRTVVYDFSSET